MGLHVALVAAALAGCAVGPDYRRPAPPAVASYTAEALPAGTATAPGVAGATQRFVSGGDIPARWWELFQSRALDRWIREALANSPTLGAAEATLRRAQEIRRALFGDLLPSVDGSVSASRQKPLAASFLGESNIQINPFTLYNASVNVSYTLDLFGKTRRGLEALQAQVDYQGFQVDGAYLTLTSNIVTAAFQEASLRGQLQATRDILATQEELLAMVEKQFELGGVAKTDVLAQRASLAQSRAALPPLEKRLAQTRHLLAVLAGGFPGATADLPEFELKEFRLPEELPVSLPSSLVRQRPDIRSAEELLHAASAAVGVATANLYPQVTLSGQYGTTAIRIEDLFRPDSAVWRVGAGLLQPIFHGGALEANRRAEIAGFDQAAAQYRETVLQAFREVADVLRALEYDAMTLRAQSDAEAAARDTLEIAKKQVRFGATSYLSLLNAQRQYHLARILLVQAQALRFADTAALFQALGGGWWNRENPSAGVSRQ
ncbi:efflux transporter outer membrane subunit [Candidatus Deferrimicrobium sp.]|uniref:efflux transporter outer membrane subunit n=1 Tax=Candidatus Deferrimicrobium sp. TaxID=3060586 RepID=UPI002ED0D823